MHSFSGTTSVTSCPSPYFQNTANTPKIHIQSANAKALMQSTFLTKYLSLCFACALAFAAAIDIVHGEQNDSKTNAPQQPAQSNTQTINGKITDIITAGGITYIEVDTGKGKVWAAGASNNALEKGNMVSFSADMPMQNFHSQSLNRDFVVIYFVTQFINTDHASDLVAPSAQGTRAHAPQPATKPGARTPGEVVTGSILEEASLDGLNTGNKPISEYKGKPLIINVWASWCGPCRDEMGSLERLAKRYNGNMFNIIGISIDDYREKASSFLDQADVSFDNYIDHELQMENMLGADMVPLTVLINADGRVLMKVRGSREWDDPEIIKAIAEVLNIKLM
jgi:thiol-disulfide isomerase/thioredoxin